MPRPPRPPKGPPALASRPLPEARGGPILPHAPPVTVAPRLRALYQSRVLARVLPDYPHLHAFSMEDLAKEWNVPVPALAAGGRCLSCWEKITYRGFTSDDIKEAIRATH